MHSCGILLLLFSTLLAQSIGAQQVQVVKIKRTYSDGVLSNESFHDTRGNPILIRSFDAYEKCISVLGLWYDSKNRKIREVQIGRTHTYVYMLEYDSAGNYIQLISYDQNGVDTTSFDPAKYSSREAFLRDTAIQRRMSPAHLDTISVWTYNKQGQETNYSIRLPNGTLVPVADLTYDSKGDMITRRVYYPGGLTADFLFSYDNQHRLLMERHVNYYPNGSSDTIEVRSLKYDDVNGVVSLFEYTAAGMHHTMDSLYNNGQLYRVVEYDESGKISRTIHYTYNSNGDLISSWYENVALKTSNEIRFEYQYY